VVLLQKQGNGIFRYFLVFSVILLCLVYFFADFQAGYQHTNEVKQDDNYVHWHG
jgi:hypothetical protein